jgi:hypothetical protein
MRTLKFRHILATLAVSMTLAVTALASFQFKVKRPDKDYVMYMDCKDGRVMKAVLWAGTYSNVTVDAAAPCSVQWGKGGITGGNIKYFSGGETITVSAGYIQRM